MFASQQEVPVYQGMTSKNKEVSSAADIIGAAAAVVSIGGSFLGKTIDLLMSNSYLITCGIEIENWTKYPLIKPCSSLEHGAMAQPPPAKILPAKKEVVIANKTSFCATGSEGTVSWLLEGKDRRVVIMWSVPFDYNIHSNWFGIGLTEKGITNHDNEWFNKLYWGDKNHITHDGEFYEFKRSEFRSRCDEILIKDRDFEVSGSIGTGHLAKAQVTVKPLIESSMFKQHLALPIAALLA